MSPFPIFQIVLCIDIIAMVPDAHGMRPLGAFLFFSSMVAIHKALPEGQAGHIEEGI